MKTLVDPERLPLIEFFREMSSSLCGQWHYGHSNFWTEALDKRPDWRKADLKVLTNIVDLAFQVGEARIFNTVISEVRVRPDYTLDKEQDLLQDCWGKFHQNPGYLPDLISYMYVAHHHWVSYVSPVAKAIRMCYAHNRIHKLVVLVTRGTLSRPARDVFEDYLWENRDRADLTWIRENSPLREKIVGGIKRDDTPGSNYLEAFERVVFSPDGEDLSHSKDHPLTWLKPPFRYEPEGEYIETTLSDFLLSLHSPVPISEADSFGLTDNPIKKALDRAGDCIVRRVDLENNPEVEAVSKQAAQRISEFLTYGSCHNTPEAQAQISNIVAAVIKSIGREPRG